MKEIYKDEVDYALRKRYGYWGWRYLDYLKDNITAAWYRRFSEADYL